MFQMKIKVDIAYLMDDNISFFRKEPFQIIQFAKLNPYTIQDDIKIHK